MYTHIWLRRDCIWITIATKYYCEWNILTQTGKVAKCWLDILIYIQQDATLHILFYPETALHVSSGTTTHHQERIQLYLQHLLFVTPLLLSAARGR